MNKELLILHYKNRIEYLTKRNEDINRNLIQKARRNLRKIEKSI